MSPEFTYSDILPLGQDTTKYRSLGSEGVTTIQLGDKKFLQVTPEAIARLSETASMTSRIICALLT